jgi:2'-5' RNA ligase
MIADSESWRVFCAIEFPPKVAERAIEHIKLLREAYPRTQASWIRDGNFHLTLKFIGEIPRPDVDKLSEAARRAVAGLSAFNLVVSGAGSFPKSGPAKVLWLGIEDHSGQLNILHERLEREGALEGFAKEERTFHPHLTIARLRKITGARELAAAHRECGFHPVKALISELVVIRSELSSAGSKYTVVSRHPF